MRASNFYSAEVVEASAKHGRRIRVKNRGTDEPHYYDYGEKFDARRIAGHLERRIIDIYWSIPYLHPRILWYDEALKVLFFELIPRDGYGNSQTET